MDKTTLDAVEAVRRFCAEWAGIMEKQSEARDSVSAKITKYLFLTLLAAIAGILFYGYFSEEQKYLSVFCGAVTLFAGFCILFALAAFFIDKRIAKKSPEISFTVKPEELTLRQSRDILKLLIEDTLKGAIRQDVFLRYGVNNALLRKSPDPLTRETVDYLWDDGDGNIIYGSDLEKTLELCRFTLSSGLEAEKKRTGPLLSPCFFPSLATAATVTTGFVFGYGIAAFCLAAVPGGIFFYRNFTTGVKPTPFTSYSQMKELYKRTNFKRIHVKKADTDTLTRSGKIVSTFFSVALLCVFWPLLAALLLLAAPLTPERIVFTDSGEQ